MKRTYCLILSILINLLHSQVSLMAQNKIDFQHFTVKEGLSQDTIQAIYQDKEGFIWLGTQDGLNKFDGLKFTVYGSQSDNISSHLCNYLHAIHEDTQQYLWFGSKSHGLFSFNKRTEEFIQYKFDDGNIENIAHNTIRDIYQEPETPILWLGTDNGIVKFNKTTKEFTPYPYPNSNARDNRVEVIHQEENTLWIGTAHGLYLFNKITHQYTTYSSTYPQVNRLLNNQAIFDIYKDAQGDRWIATQAGLLLLKNDKSFQLLLPSVQVSQIYESSDQSLWVGTSNEGLKRYHRATKTFETYQNDKSNPYSLNNNRITSIIEDKTGVMWVGTYFGGINKFYLKQKKFPVYKHETGNPNSLIGDVIRCIYEVRPDVYWIGSTQGISQLDYQTGTFTNYNQDNLALSHNDIRWIIKDDLGNTWVGTRNGLDIFDTNLEKIKTYLHDPNNSKTLSDNHIRNIMPDQDSIVWVGTFNGGFHQLNYKSGEVIRLMGGLHEGKIPAKTISHLFKDSKNNLWIATAGEGLFRKVTNKEGKISFINYKHDNHNPKSLVHNLVKGVYEDAQGNIWVNTAGGFSLLDQENSTFTNYTHQDGLPNNMVYSMLEDSNGNFWMSTNKGISKFNPTHQKFRNYDESDGLQSNEFNTGAFFKSKDGKLFFGGVKGLNVFYPEKIIDDQNVPAVKITALQLFHKDIKPSLEGVLKKHISFTDDLYLSHNQYVFSFEFAALHYANPSKNDYAYMLENFDEEWIYDDKGHNFVTYTSIPPGEYTFKVKASNQDKVWNPTPTSINIIIAPPIWASNWFISMITLLVLGSTFGAYKMRTRNIKLQKAKLEKLVVQRTKEIEQQKEETNKAYEDVRLLSNIGQGITANLTVPTIIDVVYESVNTLMDASVFAIGIYNPSKQRLDFLGTKEKGVTLPTHYDSLSDQNCLSVYCFKEQKSLFIGNLVEEYRHYLPKMPPPAAGEVPASLLYLPLISKEKCIGVISVQSFEKNAYLKYHANILNNLAVYTAIALENASSYEQITSQQIEISRKNRGITESIQYAKRIQNAMLPPVKWIQTYLSDFFVLFQPRDIVSGDFYWFANIPSKPIYEQNQAVHFSNQKIAIAAVDCTGHGVPGALMSMIGNALLDEAINSKQLTEPNEILNELRIGINKALKQKQTNNRDGMDIALCVIDIEDKRVEFSGAKNPLIFIDHHKELKEIKGNNIHIGGMQHKKLKEKKFDKTVITLEDKQSKGCFYIFSDGYQDQPGGAEGRKFMKKRLKEFLLEIHEKPMHQQKELLQKTLFQWMNPPSKGKAEKQIDDILVMGFKL